MDSPGIPERRRWSYRGFRPSLAALASTLYAAAGLIWITVSDQVAEALIPDTGQLTLFQSYKGWLFVIATALLMYVLLRRAGAAGSGAAAASGLPSAAPLFFDIRATVVTQLVLLVLAVALPLCALLGWAIYRSAQDEVASANRLVRDLARITAQDTAKFIDDTARSMEQMARRPLVRALDAGQCDPALGDVSTLNPNFVNALTFDAAGRLTCSALPVPPGAAAIPLPQAMREQLRAGNRVALGRPEVGPVSRRQVLIMGVPIRGEDGQAIGTMVFSVDNEALRPAVRPVLPEAGVVGIVSTEGIVIYGESPARRGKDGRDSEIVRIAIVQKQGSTVVRGYDGRRRNYSFLPVAGSDWIVVAGLPTDVIYGEARIHAWRGGLLGLVIILLAAIAGTWMSRRIAGPIVGIAGAARRVAEGDFSARAPEHGAREVAAVARQFNRMLDRMPLIEGELLESEQRYKNLFESSPECIFVHAEGRILMINQAGARIYGAASPAQMVGMLVADLAHPDDRAVVEARVREVTYERHELPARVLKNRRLDGTTIIIEVMSLPFDYQGRPAVLTQLRDITARQAAERRVARLSNLYAALSRSNEALVRETSREAMARAVCRIVVEYGQIVTAVIRMFNPATQHYEPFATHGPLGGWIGERSIAVDEAGSHFAVAVREQHNYVCNDLAAYPGLNHARDDATRLGIRASAIFPLVQDGKVIGGLTVFSSEIGFFDPELAALFDEMVRNLTFAFGKLTSEQALHDSEARYRALVDAAPDAIGVIIDGVIVMANPATARLYGAASVDEIIGKTGLSLTHPDSHAEVRSAVGVLMDHPGAVVRAEVRHVRLDGTAFDAEVVRAPFIYYGKPALQVIVRDITARKEATRRIARLTNLYAALSRTNAAIARETDPAALSATVCRIAVEYGNLLTAFIAMLEPDGASLVPSGAFGRVAGLIGARPVPLQPGAPGATGPLATAVREAMPVICNDMFADPTTAPAQADAAQFGIAAVAAFPLLVDGRVIGALTVYAGEVGFFDAELADLLREMALNLSFAFAKLQSEAAHRASELALRDSEARYRSLFSTSPVCIYVRQDDKVALINPAGMRLFGATSPDQVIGLPVTRLVHPGFHATMMRRHAQVLADGVPAPPIEFRNLRLDGTVIETESSVIPFEFQGRPAVQIIVTDITVRKQAERALLRANAELEQRVRERTAELQRANQELSEFSYIVSHDLKAPLRGVASLVGWLEQDHGAALGEEGRELLRLLSTRSRRMHRLIEDILHFSRLGRTREAPGEVDLERLVHEVIDSLAVPAHIEVRIEGSLPRVTGEETRLRQVFQNLISNAVKFMDKPQGLVTIGWEALEEDGTLWRFCVADNGPGIEARHFERIFDIFQTLSPRDDPDSTGIGLTVVKKIIELAGGRIWVESEPGKGARFMFTLPRRSAATDAGVIDTGEEAHEKPDADPAGRG